MKEFIIETTKIILIFAIFIFVTNACDKINENKVKVELDAINFCGGYLDVNEYYDDNKIDWKSLSEDIEESCLQYYYENPKEICTDYILENKEDLKADICEE